LISSPLPNGEKNAFSVFSNLSEVAGVGEMGLRGNETFLGGVFGNWSDWSSAEVTV